MADKAELLINNKKMREEMGLYAHQKMTKAWEIETMVKEIDNIYQTYGGNCKTDFVKN